MNPVWFSRMALVQFPLGGASDGMNRDGMDGLRMIQRQHFCSVDYVKTY